MATFKHTGGVSAFRDKLITGMVANGYEREFAEQTFSRLRVLAVTDFRNAMQPLLR
jgi:DNA polymerase III alpha subunit